MALELVTSKTGAFHVDSADDRLLHARTMGGGNYVLYGCECTMTTANKLHIAEGEMLLQGGFVRITNGGEDVTITNGSQGQKRNTLVCFDWTKGAQDIEATSLVAINGANTTGTPADPSYAEGDMNSGDTHVQIPICRITLNGLTVGDPVVLLDDFESISDLRETISQPNRVYGTETSSLSAYKVGCVAFVVLSSYRATVKAFTENIIATLPSSVKPVREVSCSVRSSLAESGGALVVKTNGQVALSAGGVDLNNAFYNATISYPVAN